MAILELLTGFLDRGHACRFRYEECVRVSQTPEDSGILKCRPFGVSFMIFAVFFLVCYQRFCFYFRFSVVTGPSAIATNLITATSKTPLTVRR